MKLTKIKSETTCELWEFFKKNMPSSLRATKLASGYGVVYGIEIKDRKDFFGYLPWTDGIATITHNCVELRYPEWFSDFEEIIVKYERQTGKEVEFVYYES